MSALRVYHTSGAFIYRDTPSDWALSVPGKSCQWLRWNPFEPHGEWVYCPQGSNDAKIIPDDDLDAAIAWAEAN